MCWTLRFSPENGSDDPRPWACRGMECYWRHQVGPQMVCPHPRSTRHHTNDFHQRDPVPPRALRPMPAVILVPLLLPLATLSAQSSPPPASASASAGDSLNESQQRPPAFATGIGVGAMHYHGGRNTSGVAATLQYSPQTWLTLSATPGLGHTSLGRTSSSGLTDMPLSVGASHAVGDLPLSPSISGSLYTSLSFADTTKPLGFGRNPD